MYHIDRGQAQGKVNYKFSAEFQNAGFKLGAEVNGEVYVYKYIEGNAYFEPPYPDFNCNKDGNCVWNYIPVREFK